jgi:shikimate kinase
MRARPFLNGPDGIAASQQMERYSPAFSRRPEKGINRQIPTGASSTTNRMKSGEEMAPTPSNLVLIGMPGSGKSTVGVLLAKKRSCSFVDTDLLIQTSQKRSLQDIVDNNGYAALRKIEESVLLDLGVHNHVIATGGSAVYSDSAMAHLKRDGLIIFLDVDLAQLESRIADVTTRGLAKPPQQSFPQLFNERWGLYARHADITIKCSGRTPEEVCAMIIKEISGCRS